MNAKHTFLVSLASVALCAGCASSGPNTERGAATGAALGAVGGAVLGNNIGGHHALLGAAIGAAAGGVAGGAYGNRRDQQQGTAYNTTPPVTNQELATGGWVQEPPPMPTSEPQDTYSPQPAPNAVWVRGHYEYTGDSRNYDWVPGHWETPPPGASHYVPGHWEQHSQGYAWISGNWQ